MEWQEDDDCLSFWRHNKTALDKLFVPAMRALSVAAPSSAVECVFSHGGIILRPHRARMSDKLMSELIFLKHNSGTYRLLTTVTVTAVLNVIYL